VGFNRAVKDPEVATPNLDAMVSDGIRLSRHYVHRYVVAGEPA
jgi:arylsulfatase A-like enzyme